MLQFFRKHQKVFFAVTALFVIVSFIFFGSASSMRGSEGKEVDSVIGTAIDGSNLSKNEMASMVRFLGLDDMDMPSYNPCNDGVIKNDFLKSGLGAMVVESYFDELKGDLEKKFERQKRYKTYVHPQAPMIATAQMMPELVEKLAEYQAREAMDVEAAKALIDLCVGESQMPPHMLYNMLRFQEQQYNVRADPNLGFADVALFGAHSVSDVFGQRFIELVAETIHNGAIRAKELGYKVSKTEARVDVQKHGYEMLHMRKQEGSLNDYLRYIGLNEEEVVNIWQKVLLFRRHMEDKANSVIVDPIVYKKLHAFAGESVELDVYELPVNKDDAKELQAYVTAVSADSGPGLPRKFLSYEKVSPELVEKRFLIDIQEVGISDIALGIGLREMWAWQQDRANLEMIKTEFPEVRAAKGKLDELEMATREKVDAYSRNKMAAQRDYLITGALDAAHVQRRAMSVKLSDTNELTKLLETQDSIDQYTADEKEYVRVRVLDRSKEPEILTFAEAKERAILQPVDNETISPRLAFELKEALKMAKEGTVQVAEQLPMPAEGRLTEKQPLADQWNVKKMSRTYTRKNPVVGFDESILSKEVGSWDQREDDFYAVANKGEETTSLADEMAKGQELLGNEAKKEAFAELLKEQICLKN